MKSFIQFIMETRKTFYMDIDKIHPIQRLNDSNKQWVDFLRKHIRSKKSEKEGVRKANKEYGGEGAGPEGGRRRTLWHPIQVSTEPDVKFVPKLPSGKTHAIDDGHHRYWARKLEGKKRIKVIKTPSGIKGEIFNI